MLTTANASTHSINTDTGDTLTGWCESTTTTTADDVWPLWCDGTGSTTTTTDAVWVTWASDSTLVVRSSSDNVFVLPERTPEQQQAHEAQRQAARDQQIKKDHQERIKRRERHNRAVVLLCESLNKKQHIEFDKHGHFFVRAPSNNLYRIRSGRAGNVDLMSKNAKKVIHRLCAHPNIRCPDEDTMLVQKIMLEHFEDKFLETANIYAA